MLPRKVQKNENFRVMYDLWNALIDHLRGDRLVAGAGIRLQKLPAGTTITATARGGGGVAAGVADDGYRGYFKIVEAPEENPKAGTRRMRLTNGWYSDPAEAGENIAGYVTAYSAVPRPVKSRYFEVSTTGTHYVYLRFVDVDGEDPFEFGVASDESYYDGLGNVVTLAVITPTAIQQRVQTTTSLVMGNPYQRDFCVVPAGKNKYKIQGGETDVGKYDKETIMSASQASFVRYYLIITRGDNGEYTLSVDTKLPARLETPHGYVILAGVTAVGAMQEWQDGPVYFGERYIL